MFVIITIYRRVAVKGWGGGRAAWERDEGIYSETMHLTGVRKFCTRAGFTARVYAVFRSSML